MAVFKGFENLKKDFCPICEEEIQKTRVWGVVPGQEPSVVVFVGFVEECACGRYWFSEPSATLPEESFYGGLPVGNPKEKPLVELSVGH